MDGAPAPRLLDWPAGPTWLGRNCPCWDTRRGTAPVGHSMAGPAQWAQGPYGHRASRCGSAPGPGRHRGRAERTGHRCATATRRGGRGWAVRPYGETLAAWARVTQRTWDPDLGSSAASRPHGDSLREGRERIHAATRWRRGGGTPAGLPQPGGAGLDLGWGPAGPPGPAPLVPPWRSQVENDGKVQFLPHP